VAMDVLQLFIYLSGAGAAMVLILGHLPGGWSDVVRYATAGENKFALLNLTLDGGVWGFLASPYTLVGSLLGGTFLTMASHGTDQLLVQRLLGCRSRWDSQRALMLDATFIVLQFAFFLLLGLCLFAFYGGVSYQALGLSSSDEVFPKFIVQNLPTGVAGLVIAGVLASAMGTLSSSISALASSTFLDLVKLTRSGRSLNPSQEVRWSRLLTLGWGVVLIGGAMLFTDTKNPVVELGLKIASVTYGGLLGTFFLGLLFKKVDQIDAVAGFVAGLITMVTVVAWGRVDFTWHTFIGCIVTILAGNLSRLVRSQKEGASTKRYR
jgi:SSS family solute:Na+ symporter